ncbi:patatin-like protein [Novosphingobium colocasiae]|uniref:PNPLA domain-containing protein n=1 Tax=Novosphingobium colocasiae TaxID=1256513 RepID=A0A918UDM4_9SPHN|nr:patatin-like protein [Novosphingobium colocasiae]GGY97364.1 hypothetical protein GCM10011614_10450 [Novosphingobium colocasiae]
MRHKELRIALVCYGGISLAVYMHGVTKEIWKVLRASRVFWNEADGQSATEPPGPSEAVYLSLLQKLETDKRLKLRVLVDILAGASAGGINGVFLAQAIHSGQSLEPLTGMWLECADVDVLLDPDARPWSKAAKFWAAPIVSALLHRPGNAVNASVAPETREEVREKLSRLIRSRWFEPPFSGIGFSRLLCRALTAMAAAPAGAPLLPDRHPIDLSVTATDFKGHAQTLRLHSPGIVVESEHRLPIRFTARHRRADTADQLGTIPELVFAARATASFPGAFPPLEIAEIDRLTAEAAIPWPQRDGFLQRIMPEHARADALASVALIDGSVLVNAPFSDAMSVLRNRPAAREVDRRFVYIDPTPERGRNAQPTAARAPGFFPVIFGSLSGIPREQPIRDNLEVLERRSREVARLRSILEALRPDVDAAVERLFGGAFFLDWPTPRRIAAWRARAQQQAWEQAGFAYQGYAQVKFSGVVSALARLAFEAAPPHDGLNPEGIAQRLHAWLAASGLDRLRDLKGPSSAGMAAFLRAHDLDFRIRRLRLLARRVTQDWEDEPGVTDADRDEARERIYAMLAVYLALEPAAGLAIDLTAPASSVMDDPGAFLDQVAAARALVEHDAEIDARLCEALAIMPPPLRRRVLLTFLGFPFYDTATLPLFRGEGFNEFDPVKVDRISPQDCNAIRPGKAAEALRGTEFYNFGAFFSRAYRENDYLWGRLQGAERMIDLIASTLDPVHALSAAETMAFKKAAFLAILEEEEGNLRTDPALVAGIRGEVEAMG